MPSTAGGSARSKTLTYADGSTFSDALRQRGVQLSQRRIPDLEQIRPLVQLLENVQWYDNADSLTHAMNTRLMATNESTFYLAFEFLITGWLCRLEKLRYVFNAQWRIDPLESTPGSSPIAAPKPDLTIGFEEAYLTGGSIISRPVNDSAPVICDHRIEYPCVTVQVEPNEVPQWISQNLHNSAVMLRTLRTLWIQSHGQTGFDEKVHVVTVSISRNLVEAFVHWTGVDEFGDILYHHAPIESWSLGIGGTEWVKARSGIKSLVEWVTDENEGWIMNALRNIRHTQN